MKAEKLKAYLSYISDDENIKINVGGRVVDLESIDYNGKEIILCGHNYSCNDDEITIANIAAYLTTNENKLKNTSKY